MRRYVRCKTQFSCGRSFQDQILEMISEALRACCEDGKQQRMAVKVRSPARAPDRRPASKESTRPCSPATFDEAADGRGGTQPPRATWQQQQGAAGLPVGSIA